MKPHCTALALALFATTLGHAAASAAEPEPASAAGATSALPAPASTKELFARFRKLSGLEAHFVERKKLALLQAPLVSQGVLYYRRPGQLARQMTSPEPSLVRIVPGQLEIEGRDGRQRVELSSRPALQLFVESFAKVLAGDEAALRKHFNVAYEVKSTTHWALGLSPKGAPLNQLVQKLSVHGRGSEVVSLTVVEKSGDRTTTEFVRVNAERRFTAEEVRRWFTIEASEVPPPSKSPAR